jgi:ADP-ribose pyrophosphatase
MKPYKLISKAVIFRNPWWQYCCDQIELPSGKRGEFHYVRTNGSSMVIAEAEEGRLLLVRQYRYTGDRDSLEFPCGGVKEGATHDEAAESELAEETGFLPGWIQCVGTFNPCNGLLYETCRVYIARNLRHVGARPDESESFELVRLTAEEVDASIRDGTVWDGMTIAAWAIARPIVLARSAACGIV